MLKITKRFPDGLEIDEVTSVEFKVGFVCKPWWGCPSGYEVVKVEKVLEAA